MTAIRGLPFAVSTALVTAAALLIMQPKLPGLVVLVAGSVTTIVAARYTRGLFGAVALAVLLFITLVALAWVVFVFDVGAHGGFE